MIRGLVSVAGIVALVATLCGGVYLVMWIATKIAERRLKREIAKQDFGAATTWPERP